MSRHTSGIIRTYPQWHQLLDQVLAWVAAAAVVVGAAADTEAAAGAAADTDMGVLAALHGLEPGT